VAALYSKGSSICWVRFEAIRYHAHANWAPVAIRSPRAFQSGRPVDPNMTTATPATARKAMPMSRPVARSLAPKSRGPTKRSTRGCRAPITVAFAIVVSFTAVKNSVMSSPSAMPPGRAVRSVATVSRRPRRPSRPIISAVYSTIR